MNSDGSFKLLWETFWRFFCISCNGQAFGYEKFPTGIGILKCYRRALIGYLEIGDNLGSFKTSCYWTNCFGVLKRVEFRIILSILNNG
ncbi:unnamed protein product [Rhizophagus irregularis]|nr:unnamed protein product [Rhizophagus irregularis]